MELPFGMASPQASLQNQGRETEQYTIADNSSLSFGNHTFRFGGEANLLDITSVDEFTTTPIWTINNGNANTPSLDAALFPGGIAGSDLGAARNLRFLLGGFVETGTVQANYLGGNSGRVVGARNFDKFEYGVCGMYLQDQWRVRPDLILNLGVRWDYFSALLRIQVFLTLNQVHLVKFLIHQIVPRALCNWV